MMKGIKFLEIHQRLFTILLHMQQCLTKVIDHMEDDITFLNEGLEKATKLSREKNDTSNIRRNIEMSRLAQDERLHFGVFCEKFKLSKRFV